MRPQAKKIDHWEVCKLIPGGGEGANTQELDLRETGASCPDKGFRQNTKLER